MLKRLRNWGLIFIWELIFLLRSLPYVLNANKRKGPDFIIIGASKSGTTFLFNYLSKHTQLKLSRMKEPRFFNRYYCLGLNYYKSYFPLKSEGKLCGEATTSYFYDERVPLRIKKHFPNVKLILLLRDPICRAYSHYQMNKNDEQADNFIEALALEASGRTRYHYTESSMYMRNLEHWMKSFASDQIKIIKSEEMFQHAQSTISEVFDFLGLEPISFEQYQEVNQNYYAPLNKEEYEKASSYFEEDMKLLAGQLGENFKWEYKE